MNLSPVHVRQRNYNFDLSEKKKLLLLAAETSQASVCKLHNIPKGTFSGWKQQIDLDLDYEKGKFTKHPGRKSKGEHLENVIDSFIEGQEQGQKECTVDLIALEILKFDPEFQDGDFGNVKRWLYPYLKRNGFSIRSKTHVAQKECDNDICFKFNEYVNEINAALNINPDFVINMDETPCYYDNRPKTKVVTSGSKSVNGAKTRTGDYRATVCLAAAATGKKLEPFIIFKGQPGKTNY
jgi:hypothetical protein